MKKLILFVVVMGSLLFAAAAHGDKAADPGCGQALGKSAVVVHSIDDGHLGGVTYTEWVGAPDNGHARIVWEQNCNVGPISVEIEYQTNANTGIWHDAVVGGTKQDYTRPTNVGGFDKRQYDFPQATCDQSADYRMRLYDYNSNNYVAFDCTWNRP